MFPGNPTTYSPLSQPPFPFPFMGQPANQYASPSLPMQPGQPPFPQAQAVNPWLILAWLNQFNPYANAFTQPPAPQFSWQNFWNTNPAPAWFPSQFPSMGAPAASPVTSAPTNLPTSFSPTSLSQGYFGTTNFSTSPAQPQTSASMPAYPSYPGVTSFFSSPQSSVSQTPVNPLDEHAPPRRAARNGH